MNIVLLSGSTVGSKTRIAMDDLKNELEVINEGHQIELMDLRELELEFSVGKNYLDTTGDVYKLTTSLMQADVIFIGFPIFQASIPGALKNVFDLLPVNAFRDKVIGLVATAGSSKHYLIPEMHLKPILSYMKATMQTYVFIEEKDFSNQQIVNDDVVFRLKALAQSTMRTAKVQQQVLEEENNQYDF
ncbi:NADPH-dependent FMN reductase [Staphylococcus aureus]|uniref:NADPH-dependent FMN reductase n=1 Tax=Staphylococcus aureus TaxID=1280 RepID=UPI00289F288B|nr:NADPH-dependent FMN reductase [Staphylococcus aureus]